MEQTPSRPKLRNIPVPHGVMRCFLCGKPLVSVKGDLSEEATLAATGGVVILACAEHNEAACVFLQDTTESLGAAIKQAQDEQSKAE